MSRLVTIRLAGHRSRGGALPVVVVMAAAALIACGCSAPGAPWTIQCLQMEGPHRLQHIEQVAETLRRTPGIKPQNVWVADEPDGAARLYYGTYHRRADPATGRPQMPKKLRQDLALIRQLAVGPGEYPFMRALVMRIPTPDVGDPAWALTNADGLYSLQVAVFEPTDSFWEFKQAAADYCEFLRKEGYQAYYHHSPACSLVTVGSFGANAVIPQPGGLPVFSSEVAALQREELLKYNLVNGAVVRATDAAGVGGPVRSRLVVIPGRE